MNEMLPVSAIKNGTVIDHISSGQAFRLAHLLSLQNGHIKITIGIHLPSKRLGSKDIIKLEGRVLSEQEANEIVVFSPQATINVIESYQVVDKIKTHIPSEMKKIFICSNPACITQVEPVDSYFHVIEDRRQINLSCHYCENIYERDALKVNV